MISPEMLIEARAAVERLALGQGCPTVLMDLMDRLEVMQRCGTPGVGTNVPNSRL